MKFFSQELNFVISSPTTREGAKNYFSQVWKTILDCFSSHSSRQQNTKSKECFFLYTFISGLIWTWKYNVSVIYFRHTSINAFKAFFLKLLFPIVILYLHLSTLNKLLPNVFLITTICLHFIPDNTLLLFRCRHGPWFCRLQVLSLTRTTYKPTLATLEADSWATLQRESTFLTAQILPSILLSDFWKGKKKHN